MHAKHAMHARRVSRGVAVGGEPVLMALPATAPLTRSRRRQRKQRRAVSLLGAAVLAATLATVVQSVQPPAAQAAPLGDCWASDNGDPVLTSFERTPAAVDVTDAGHRVRFRVGVDDLGGPGPATGTERVLVGFGESPSLDEGFVPTVRLVQDSTGDWVGSIFVPRWRHPGSVRLGVTLVDRAGNFRFVEAADLAAAGFPSTVTVSSVADRTPPRLTSLRIRPTIVDTRGGPRAVRVTATALDGQSGVNTIQILGLGPVKMTKVPGTRGTFSGTRDVCTWTRPGIRRIYDVWLEDRSGNVRDYGSRALGAAGFDRDLTIVSRHDTTPPAITRLHLEPTLVDVRSTDQTATVRVRAVDRQAGVRTVTAFFSARGTTWVRPLQRVSGTARDGVWEGEFKMRRCEGWRRAVRVSVSLTDNAGPRQSYNATQLAENGWPSRIAVTATDHIVPSFGTTFRPVPLVGPITVWFNESVNGINPSSAVVSRSIGDFDHGPPIAGTWACRDRTGARTDCQTGIVMVARFWPTDPLSPRRKSVVTLNP
jgi:hypothetical protein